MAARITVERILRDNGDDSGQSIREWKIEAEAGRIIIRLCHGDGFLAMRADDIDRFVGDLWLAQAQARDLAKEAHLTPPTGRGVDERGI